MPSRTSLLITLSATSILNSGLAQRPSPQSNELEGRSLQTVNELPDAIPHGSLHDTSADAVRGFEHTYFSHGEESIRALHDHDSEAAMDTLSLAHVDLVRRQLPSVALPSLAASVGVSLPTSVVNLLPTAQPTMPTAELTMMQSSAPPVVTSFVTSTTQVLPSSTPIESSPPPSSVPTSTPNSVAPVPTSTTQAPPTTTSVATTSSTSTPQESSETTMAIPTTAATLASATFSTTSSTMTLMTMMTSSDNPDLSSSVAPTSQAPMVSSTPATTSNAVGGGGIVGGGGDSSSTAVVAPMPGTSTTQAANGNGGIGGIGGGSGAGSITTTDQFGGTIVFPSTTEGAVLTLTDSSGRVFTTTYNPRGTVQETMVVSTQLSGAGGGLVTQTAFVNPSAASGIDGGQPSIATATRGQAGLQTGNVADTTHRAGAEALALAVGAIGVAWAL